MRNDKLKLLGQSVRAQIGGHSVTVLLTDYDEASDSYHGETHRNYSMNAGEKTPVVESIHGLRPYPTTDRPDYAFQFVMPGEDEQVLLDIAQENAAGHLHGGPAENQPVEEAQDDQAESKEARKARKKAEKGK